MSPLIVSLTTSNSARKKTGRHHILPPLDGEESSNTNRKKRPNTHFGSSRNKLHHHGTLQRQGSIKRSHSSSHESTPVDSVHSHHQPSTPVRKSPKVLCTPEKMSRNRHLNKIETVRILRAKPAFYPVVRDRFSSSSSSPVHKTRARTAIAAAQLAEAAEILSIEAVNGKQITLRSASDRTQEIMIRKKKRRSAKAATTVNL